MKLGIKRGGDFVLTPERHQLILELLHNKTTVKLKELVEETQASDSTVRRDLDQLEQAGQLRRIHGGASLRQSASEEPSMSEKATVHYQDKSRIAAEAAKLVRDGDCIFLDAGTTTFEMIPHLRDKNLIVVTNGLSHLEALTEHHVPTYVVGGFVKQKTRAVIGSGAITNLEQYRFDKCFLGINGIHDEDGYTTPDPEEAAVKRTALALSLDRYVLGDASKFNEITFVKVADLAEATIITNHHDHIEHYRTKTQVKAVRP
nr:DeoR/GlpR family DNA-binding transcription regulator [Thalassobacillus sp. CUG 92003]